MAIMIGTGSAFSTTRTIAQVRENSSITKDRTLRDLVDQVKAKSVEGLSGKEYRSQTNVQVTQNTRVNVTT